MEIFRTRAETRTYLAGLRQAGRTIGFVPTMGALHQGHLSLIAAAGRETDVVVCSIFVNPTQFNDKKDLENYPRPIENDIQKLREAECAVLFLPDVTEMYQSPDEWHIELNNLDKVLEGEIRPGHYQGVTQIVKKLFDIIEPDYAFFGQKDYQQFMVISYMVKKLGIGVKLIRCPIVREDDGLAMSSRNVYLSPTARQNAPALFKSLCIAKERFGKDPVSQIQKDALAFLKSWPGIEPEYFEIFNAATFEPVASGSTAQSIALVAVRVGGIRIIDNMMLN